MTLGFWELIFLICCGLIICRGLRLIIAGKPLVGLVSLTASGIYAFCMWIPARLQESGAIRSKLDNANLLAPANEIEINILCMFWVLELLIIVFAEWAGWRLMKNRASALPHGGPETQTRVPASQPEIMAAILVFVGVVATVALPAPIETRGEGGQGLETLLRTFLIVGLALIVYHGGFNKKAWWIVAVLGVVLLASTNVRSPLLVIVCAFVAAQLVRNRFRSPRVMLVAMVLVTVFALSGAFMSNWRANLTRHEGYTMEQVIASTLERPWEQVYESGIDTLDGYRFSRLIVDYEEPRPSDLLNVFLTFVPRSMWPDKPESIAVDVSYRYLGYETSGQYLSAVGYFHLVLGSYGLALLALFVFSALAALLIQRYASSFILAISLCVLIRFFLGGSSFDIYYGLTLAIPYVAAYGLSLLVYHAVSRGSSGRLRGRSQNLKNDITAGRISKRGLETSVRPQIPANDHVFVAGRSNE